MLVNKHSFWGNCFIGKVSSEGIVPQCVGVFGQRLISLLRKAHHGGICLDNIVTSRVSLKTVTEITSWIQRCYCSFRLTFVQLWCRGHAGVEGSSRKHLMKKCRSQNEFTSCSKLVSQANLNAKTKWMIEVRSNESKTCDLICTRWLLAKSTPLFWEFTIMAGRLIGR